MKHRHLAAAAAAGAFLPAAFAAQAQTALTVYTAVEADELPAFEEAFESAHPDVDIVWVRDSTGIMTAKLLAEADNPQADIIWGLAATSLMLMDQVGMLEPYAPAGLDALDPRYYDAANEVPHWVGQRAWIAAVCFNTVEAERLGLPMPASWADLADPVYQGQIVMPNPNSSGTGYLDVSSWIQIMGEDAAWDYMDALHDNIASYTHSGSKPCRMAGAGEVAIGISFAYRGAKVKEEGAPIEILTMSEGLGWDLESFGIVAGTENMAAAQAFADWSVTEAAMKLYNLSMAVVSMPGVAQPVPHFPEGITELMIENDFEWAASNRERILAEWQDRYDGKTEAQ